MEEVLAALKIGVAASTFTRTSMNNEALRASASFTPQPAFHGSMSGEIPAANPRSIVPANEPAKPSRSKLVYVGAAALAIVVGVGFATRTKLQPQPEAQPAAQKTVEKPAVAEKPAEKPSAVAQVVVPVAKAEAHFVDIDSDPPGARVRDEAKVILCDKTPCKVNVESASLVVIVEQDGYSDQKVKLSQNDARHLVKLTKQATWHPPPQAAAAAAPKPAPAGGAGFKPDPYGGGPY